MYAICSMDVCYLKLKLTTLSGALDKYSWSMFIFPVL